MNIDELIKYFGSQSKATKAIGRTRQAFTRWNSCGYIPIKAQLEFQKVTGGFLVADTNDLRKKLLMDY